MTLLRMAQLLRMTQRCTVAALLALAWGGPALAAAPPPAQSAKKATSGAAGSEEFFIISSVDTEKKELLLKRPTEVTEVVNVSDATRYLDQAGKPIKLADLRAGDTVFVALTAGGAAPVAARIRKGPMTVEELHRRYLH